MIRYDDPAVWRDERAAQLRRGGTLGFVPTMGALHEGHRSLVARSRAENDRTLVSVFVNPTQFDDPDDFGRYEQALDADLRVLREDGVEFVLTPSPERMYPDGFRYQVHETERSLEGEGRHRPGHFVGVLTVVLKLLQIARADRAYFGEKDWQQLELVRGLAAAFFVPTAIVGCHTVREADGLACSSRNRRLGVDARRRAPLLFRALSDAPSAASASERLRDAGFEIDYVEDRDGRRLGAVRLDGVRLIDNVPLGGST